MAPALAVINETFHRPPGVEQSDAVIVNDFPILIARIEVISRLEGKGRVDQIEIRVTDPQSLANSHRMRGAIRSGR